MLYLTSVGWCIVYHGHLLPGHVFPFFLSPRTCVPQEQMTRRTHVLGNSIPGITNILDYHIESYDLHFVSQLIRYCLASYGAPACCPQDSRASAAAFGS